MAVLHDTRHLRPQAGFALFEVIGAMFVISIGLVGVLTAFDMANKTAFVAQRHEQAVGYAQAEIERLKTLKFSQLALRSTPVTSTSGNLPDDPRPNNPLNPNFYVTSSGFKIMNDYQDSTSGTISGTPAGGERFVVDATNGLVEPGPQSFTTGQTTGKIYRYVTWRDEQCAATDDTRCPGDEDSKRITVAVALDPVGNGAPPTKPIYVSSVLVDPEALPPNTPAPPEANPGSGAAVSSQPFFLYDTPCSQPSRQAPTASHATRNTSQGNPSCSGSDTPDLMGNLAPPAPDPLNPPPVLDYSNDLTRTSPAGLALKLYSTSCPTSYTSSQASTLKQSIHTWATQPFASSFSTPNSGARASLSFWVRSVNGAAGGGTLCATLRRENGNTLTAGTYTIGAWPTEPTQLSFAWDVASPFTIPAGERLLLTLSLRSTSATDVELLYDHPNYATFVAVATTTPLS